MHVELYGSVDQACLQVNGLSLLGLVTEQCQLSISPFGGRQLLYVRNKPNFVHLHIMTLCVYSSVRVCLKTKYV